MQEAMDQKEIAATNKSYFTSLSYTSEDRKKSFTCSRSWSTTCSPAELEKERDRLKRQNHSKEKSGLSRELGNRKESAASNKSYYSTISSFSGGDDRDRKKSVLTRSKSCSTISSLSDEDSDGDMSDTYSPDGITHDLETDAKKKRTVFNVANEIYTTEHTYINDLKLLHIDFRQAVVEAGGSKVIPDEDLEKILGNVKELLTFNSDLLGDFRSRIDNWENKPQIADIFVKKGPFLKLYTTYMKNHMEAMARLSDCCNKYPMFNNVVKMLQAKEELKGLEVEHYFLTPVQRLMRYKILLESYLKNLNNNSSDYEPAVEALAIVTDAAKGANEHMTKDNKFKRMVELQTQFNDPDLIQPNRVLIKEGEFSTTTGKQIYLVLFNDALAVAKDYSTKCKLIHKIPLVEKKVEVFVQNADEFPLDFSIQSMVQGFTLQAQTRRDRDAWVAAIKEATENSRQRLQEHSHIASALTNVAAIDPNGLYEGHPARGSQSTYLGERAPIWVPDERVTKCQRCHSNFTVLKRRHHCRACGKAVCADCSQGRAPLKYKGYKVVRVCTFCFDEIEKRIEDDVNLKEREKYFKKGGSSVKAAVPARLLAKAGDGHFISGHLHRLYGDTWRKQWFVVREEMAGSGLYVMYTYKASEDASATNTDPLLGHGYSSNVDVPEELKSEHPGGRAFSLTHGGLPPKMFFAESEASAEKWETAILKIIQQEKNFYEAAMPLGI